MDPVLAIIWSRAFERLLVVVVGMLAIWIGYRLFVLMPTRKDGESKVELPGGISIYFSRIGPGTLFALFGAGLVAYSAAKPVTFEQSFLQPVTQVASQSTTKFQGMSEAPLTSRKSGIERPSVGLSAQTSIGMINDWLKETGDVADTGIKGRRIMAAREAKLAIMREIWDDTLYGPYGSFHNWVVQEAAEGNPPLENSKAAKLFLGQQL